MDDLRQRTYRIFDPAPLETADQRKRLYVELDPARGDSAVVHLLGSRIELAQSRTVQLLTGHPGSGKSTELFALKADLEKKNWFVVFTDVARAGRDLDLSDLDFPELLVVVLHDLVEQIEPLGIQLQPGYFQDLFGRFKDLLFSRWEISELGLKAGLLELSGAVRTPDTRRKIRELIAPAAKDWLYAANDVLDNARRDLLKKGKRDIALIVDGLDKLVDDQRDRAGWRENLFKDRRPEMGGLRCHVVYTIPIDIVLTSRGNVIAGLYDMTEIPVVPMVKLRERPPSQAPCQPGSDLFREVVTRRLFELKAKDADVFEDAALDELIALSGGQIRQLMLMVRDACARALPITPAAVRQVARSYRLQYSYWLGPQHWALIEQARASGSVPPTDQNRDALAELLESRALLQYRNDEQWYGVNPLLPSPAVPPPAASPPPAPPAEST